MEDANTTHWALSRLIIIQPPSNTTLANNSPTWFQMHAHTEIQFWTDLESWELKNQVKMPTPDLTESFFLHLPWRGRSPKFPLADSTTPTGLDYGFDLREGQNATKQSFIQELTKKCTYDRNKPLQFSFLCVIPNKKTGYSTSEPLRTQRELTWTPVHFLGRNRIPFYEWKFGAKLNIMLLSVVIFSKNATTWTLLAEWL